MLVVGVLLLILIVGTPTILLLMLFYFGEKSRRAEQRDNRFFRRGFEVKLNTGGEPVLKKERENDHG